ncbi:hypothetical protein BGX23_007777 [Mortierella sp. AD031]|nr:hypothetical protein BGX23_007777 [Mortierella sp. AD031]
MTTSETTINLPSSSSPELDSFNAAGQASSSLNIDTRRSLAEVLLSALEAMNGAKSTPGNTTEPEHAPTAIATTTTTAATVPVTEATTTTMAETIPPTTDVTMRGVGAEPAKTTQDAGVTTTVSPAAPTRRSSRLLMIKATANQRDATASDGTSPNLTHTANKRGSTEDTQAVKEAAPVKRRKKTAGKDTSAMDGQDDGGVGSSTGATLAPKKRGRPSKNRNAAADTPRTTAGHDTTAVEGQDAGVGSSTGEAPARPTTADANPSTPPTPSASTDKKGKGKEKALFDPLPQEGLDEIDDAGDDDQDGMEVDGQDDDVGSSSIAVLPISRPTKTNPLDPFSALPVEILQQILMCLPLPVMTRMSLVSKGWLDAVHYLSVWKTVCDTAGLGEPKKKYKTHMALACANSYWICERCFSFSNAKTHRADLPLPVADKDDGDRVRMLCLKCRREYFHRHPEPLKKGTYRNEFHWVPQTGSLAPNGIFINYDLPESNLGGLDIVGHSGQGLPLYDRSEVQRLALRVHGGWVGVDAGATNPRRQRASICNARAKAAKICTRSPPKVLSERSIRAAEKREAKEKEQRRRARRREHEKWLRRRERRQRMRLEWSWKHPERVWEDRHNDYDYGYNSFDSDDDEYDYY